MYMYNYTGVQTVLWVFGLLHKLTWSRMHMQKLTQTHILFIWIHITSKYSTKSKNEIKQQQQQTFHHTISKHTK